MKFTKMHGIGNDYIFVNCYEEDVTDPHGLARDMSARHFGVGADGLILIQPSEVADVGMRIFNADGSEAEMCGNGIRCLAKYAYEHGMCTKTEMAVETKAGIRIVQLLVEGGKVKAVTVDMGVPGLTRAEIPMVGDREERVIGETLRIGGENLEITCVSMGNPHCIVPVERIDLVPWRELGRQIEVHELFPHRTNVEFVEVFSEQEVMVAVWERGVGPTLACGTGASAVCVAMNLLGRTGPRIKAHLPGGDLSLEWAENRHVYMTGPAEEVFTGQWPT